MPRSCPESAGFRNVRVRLRTPLTDAYNLRRARAGVITGVRPSMALNANTNPNARSLVVSSAFNSRAK